VAFEGLTVESNGVQSNAAELAEISQSRMFENTVTLRIQRMKCQVSRYTTCQVYISSVQCAMKMAKTTRCQPLHSYCPSCRIPCWHMHCSSVAELPLDRLEHATLPVPGYSAPQKAAVHHQSTPRSAAPAWASVAPKSLPWHMKQQATALWIWLRPSPGAGMRLPTHCRSGVCTMVLSILVPWLQCGSLWLTMASTSLRFSSNSEMERITQ
jgi:hypothetical protein